MLFSLMSMGPAPKNAGPARADPTEGGLRAEDVDVRLIDDLIDRDICIHQVF